MSTQILEEREALAPGVPLSAAHTPSSATSTGLSGFRLEYASCLPTKIFCSGQHHGQCRGVPIDEGTLVLINHVDFGGWEESESIWRWGCLTPKVIGIMVKGYGASSPDAVPGYDALTIEDQKRVRTAWSRRQVARDDVFERPTHKRSAAVANRPAVTIIDFFKKPGSSSSGPPSAAKVSKSSASAHQSDSTKTKKIINNSVSLKRKGGGDTSQAPATKKPKKVTLFSGSKKNAV